MAWKRWLLVLSVVVGISGELIAQMGAPEDAEVLMVRQDFLKMGKKDSYDALRKTWFQDFDRLAKSGSYVPSIIGIDDLDAPMHACLVFLPNFAGIDAYFQSKDAFRKATPAKQWKDRSAAITACLHYQINSLHMSMPECSYVLPGMNGSMYNMPYVHYFIFTLVHNADAAFDAHLKKMVESRKGQKSTCYWRTWKTSFGGAVPKYVICVFAKTEEALKSGLSNLTLIDAETKPLVVRQREGRGMVRKDLSLIVK